jgi:adenylosuccinate synthase
MALLPFSSQLIADAGISMGDEGKGRLIYEVIDEIYAQENCPETPIKMILKVNGGANSGHTAAGLKLNLLPTGVAENRVPHLGIGMGVVADPHKLYWEAEPLEAAGYKLYSRLLIDQRTLVSDLSHRFLDQAWEYYRIHTLNEDPRGSTKRGISPAYSDEVNQLQIFFADFCNDKAIFVKKMKQRINRTLKTIQYVCEVDETAWNDFFDELSTAEKRANKEAIERDVFEDSLFDFRRFKGEEPFTLKTEDYIEWYWNAGQRFKNCVVDLREEIVNALEEGQYIIGEFGQSFWLDKRHGFSPNVTASHTYTPEFFQSAGIPAQAVHTMGVCKAYDTKVGTHLFLTQIEEEHPLSPILKQMEFGTSTGRQRMVGWFDAVEKGDTLRFGGFQDLVINKLDALTHTGSWNRPLLVCTHYIDQAGNIWDRVPRDEKVRSELTPVYTEFKGWSEDISKIREFQDLPIEAKRYVAGMVKAILDVAYRGKDYPEKIPNLRYIGVGPEPKQIIRDVPKTSMLIAEYVLS